MATDKPRRCPGRRLFGGLWFDLWNEPVFLASLRIVVVAGCLAVAAVAYLAGGPPFLTAGLMLAAAVSLAGSALARHVREHPSPQVLRAGGIAEGRVTWLAAYEVRGGEAMQESLRAEVCPGPLANLESSPGPPSYAFAGEMAISFVATTAPEVFRVDLYALRAPGVDDDGVAEARRLLEESLVAVGAPWAEVVVEGDFDAVAPPRASSE